MIYHIRKKEADQEKIDLLKGKKRVEGDRANYSDIIVKKPWGYEYLVFENEYVAIWMLQIVRKRKTSMHCHEGKKTGLLLLSGNALFSSLTEKIELLAPDGVVIEEGVFHSTEAYNPLAITPVSENGIWVMEIESPPFKEDLIRLKDEYGREGKRYEGEADMVFEPKECVTFKEPCDGEVIIKTFLDYELTLGKGAFWNESSLSNINAMVSVVGHDSNFSSSNSYLKIGELIRLKDFDDNTKGEDISKCTLLQIEKSPKLIKLSDYVFSFIADIGVKDVFTVCGGSVMHLVDSLGRNKGLDCIAVHSEQSAAMAAEGNARITGKPAVVLVSSGPGGSNTITGIYGAWIDSISIIFISGQANSSMVADNTGLRQFGIQEADIVGLVKPITKYSVMITDPTQIKYHLQKALHLATTGRPGPVWLDIPLDIQTKLIYPDELDTFSPDKIRREEKKHLLKEQVAKCVKMLMKAKRPVIIGGYGIRLSKGEGEFVRLVKRLGIPVITSWNASDIIESDYENYIGRSGIMGDRAGNFTVQNADLLLIIGSRMSIPQVGYNYKTFARVAQKIAVDIDEAELKKASLTVDFPIKADAREFLVEMLHQVNEGDIVSASGDWPLKCRYWKKRYPVVLDDYKDIKDKVNSFYFINLLSERLPNDSVTVADVGTSLTCTMQAFKTKKGQRLFASSGHSAMGFGLPGAIGACFANNRKRTICIIGDGGIQMSIHELQTIVHYKLPVIIFVLNNQGYLTIKLMQQNHFGKYVGADPESGLSCPDMLKIANAYGIGSERIVDHEMLHDRIDKILSVESAYLCEIVMAEDQPLVPRVSSIKKPDGDIISRPLEDLYPFLERREFLENMIIEPVEVLRH